VDPQGFGHHRGALRRRACRVLAVDTSTYHYKSRRRGQADLEQRIKEIAERGDM